MENIGTNIMELRKTKGVTQEALAEAAGVSIQAVSKWENGGCPDTALLPAIADFFEVPIDALFGRDVTKHGDVINQLRKLFDYKDGNPFHMGGTRKMANDFFEICWAFNRIIMNHDLNREIEPIADVLGQRSKENKKPHVLSRNVVDGCTILMNLIGSPYFMLMPEPKDGWKSGLLDIQEYDKLFKILADSETLKAILWLCERPLSAYGPPKPLTKKGIRDKLGFTEEQADKQIEALLKLKFITQKDIELDDAIVPTYETTIAQTPVLPLLVIAKELITQPDNIGSGDYYGHRWNNNRMSLIDSAEQTIALTPEIISRVSDILGVEVLPEHFNSTRSFYNNGLINWRFIDLQGHKLNLEQLEHNGNGNVFGSNLGDVFIVVAADVTLSLYIDVGPSEWGRAFNVTALD